MDHKSYLVCVCVCVCVVCVCVCVCVCGVCVCVCVCVCGVCVCVCVCVQSYIGSVLMRLSHSTMTTSPVVSSQFLPLFCSSIVQSLVVLSQDHSLLVCGRQSPGKGRLVTDTLSDLLLPLDDPDNRAASIVSNMQLLRYLCRTAQDDQVRGMSVTTLLVDPLTSTLKGAHFSLGLLDTTQLSAMQVEHNDILMRLHVCVYVCVFRCSVKTVELD